jgi:hypothetical protein
MTETASELSVIVGASTVCANGLDGDSAPEGRMLSRGREVAVTVIRTPLGSVKK